MARLTVVFDYPDGVTMIEAKRMFTSKSSNIPNIVAVEEYDAIEAYKRVIACCEEKGDTCQCKHNK